MSDLEKKRFTLLRVCTVLLVLIVVLLLIAGIVLLRVSGMVSGRLREIDTVIVSLQNVSGQLERIDWQTLGDTVTGVTTALDEAQLAEITGELRTVSASLAAIDWTALASDASESMRLAQEGLSEVMETLDKMDIESLNQAIIDLKTVIEPLARLIGRS